MVEKRRFYCVNVSWPGKDMLCIYVRRSGMVKRRRSVDDDVVSVTVNLFTVRRIQHWALKHRAQNYSTTEPTMSSPSHEEPVVPPLYRHIHHWNTEHRTTVQQSLLWKGPAMKDQQSLKQVQSYNTTGVQWKANNSWSKYCKYSRLVLETSVPWWVGGHSSVSFTESTISICVHLFAVKPILICNCF